MQENEFKEWLKQGTTQEYFRYLNKLREEIKEAWADSLYTGALEAETLQRNASAIGQVDLLKALLDPSYEEITEVLSDK